MTAPKLTAAQRRLLARARFLADMNAAPPTVRWHGRITLRVLQRMGLASAAYDAICVLTPAGRAALEST